MDDIQFKLAPVVQEVRKRLGNFIIAEDDQTLAGVVWTISLPVTVPLRSSRRLLAAKLRHVLHRYKGLKRCSAVASWPATWLIFTPLLACRHHRPSWLYSGDGDGDGNRGPSAGGCYAWSGRPGGRRRRA